EPHGPHGTSKRNSAKAAAFVRQAGRLLSRFRAGRASGARPARRLRPPGGESPGATPTRLFASRFQVGGPMHLVILLILFVGLAAIIIWIADWTAVPERRSTALSVLNRRLARGEIDRAEYEEKRKLLG